MLISAIVGSAVAQDEVPQQTLSLADSLYRNYQEKEALERYNAILKQNPAHYKSLWRSAFLFVRIGYRFDSEERQKQYYEKGIARARKAMAVDSTDTNSNFVLAAALGRKAMISGPNERVSASREIKKYAERAIASDSTHAGAWHVLGRLHFKLANLGFAERLAANTLFGGIPDASEEKAVQFLEKAVELEPDLIIYYFDLARVYRHVGKIDKAADTCRQALGLEPITPDDDGFQQKCRNLLTNL